VGTLVDRSTRLVLLLHLEHGRSADRVDAAMRKAIATLPDELVRSITWDRGAEMANHASFTIDTGIPIYFCDLHAHGSAARTRTPTVCFASTCRRTQTCRSARRPSSSRSIATSTDVPGKNLGYMTPSEAHAHVVAATA
jgi:IS30 family transposase